MTYLIIKFKESNLRNATILFCRDYTRKTENFQLLSFPLDIPHLFFLSLTNYFYWTPYHIDNLQYSFLFSIHCIFYDFKNVQYIV